MHDDEVDVNHQLVAELVASQHHELADLQLTVVEPWGTDNAIWRLGEDLVVRLPRIPSASGQVERDATWLPVLAPSLPRPIPEPIAIGEPQAGYPFRWAIHRWIPGEAATLAGQAAPETFARDLAAFVESLQAVPSTDAPPARNRARPLHHYDAETRRAIESASHLIDADAATEVWEQAVAATPHRGPAVWVHGDLEGNCLLADGDLSGIVDWGSVCAGDPAVDVQVAWSPLFTERSRAVFLDALGADEASVARSRGAAIHQACAALPYYLHTYPEIVERSWHKLAALGVRPLQGQGPVTG